ncbi:helix-turn-helix domain-containing protein [Streptomyces hygroscopicus]|uniref:helix-turn-helix domain-containing protein n=1 Tax=Streptomyces hygroscopicus TaxID=1912 RepID=UPI0036D0D4BC
MGIAQTGRAWSGVSGAGAGGVAEFAEPLCELKGRTDRGYAALAARGGVSGSAPHRYCSGASVPGDYEVIARFGKACGASGEELLEPHRRWVLADTERKRAVSRAPAAVSAARTGAIAASADPAAPAVSDGETGSGLPWAAPTPLSPCSPVAAHPPPGRDRAAAVLDGPRIRRRIRRGIRRGIRRRIRRRRRRRRP